MRGGGKARDVDPGGTVLRGEVTEAVLGRLVSLVAGNLKKFGLLGHILRTPVPFAYISPIEAVLPVGVPLVGGEAVPPGRLG